MIDYENQKWDPSRKFDLEVTVDYYLRFLHRRYDDFIAYKEPIGFDGKVVVNHEEDVVGTFWNPTTTLVSDLVNSGRLSSEKLDEVFDIISIVRKEANRRYPESSLDVESIYFQLHGNICEAASHFVKRQVAAAHWALEAIRDYSFAHQLDVSSRLDIIFNPIKVMRLLKEIWEEDLSERMKKDLSSS